MPYCLLAYCGIDGAMKVMNGELLHWNEFGACERVSCLRVHLGVLVVMLLGALVSGTQILIVVGVRLGVMTPALFLKEILQLVQ